MGKYSPCRWIGNRCCRIHGQRDSSSLEHQRARDEDGDIGAGSQQNGKGEDTVPIDAINPLIYQLDPVYRGIRIVCVSRRSKWIQRTMVYLRLSVSHLIFLHHPN